jgi:hypothetical protein
VWILPTALLFGSPRACLCPVHTCRLGPLSVEARRFCPNAPPSAATVVKRGVLPRQVRATLVFGDWLVRHRIAVTDIDERVVARFVGARARRRSPSPRNRRLVGRGQRRARLGQRISGRTRSRLPTLASDRKPSASNGCGDLTSILIASAGRRPGRGGSIAAWRGRLSRPVSERAPLTGRRWGRPAP